MKAAVLYETGRNLEIEDGIEIPELKRGQVLVKIHYSGVCHSQLMEVRGKRGKDKYLPHLLGHEASGIVEKVGQDVKKVSAGDRVILTWIKGDGIEAGGIKYKKNDITINAGAVTTFSEYSVVSENRCVKMPEGIPMDIGSLFGCAVLTGAGIVTNEICPKKNSSIAIFGLGGIGMSALMATLLYDCSPIFAIDVENSKLKLAKEFGATYCINASIVNPLMTILELTNGIGVDYAVEAAGLTHTIEQAFQAVRANGGLCVFASHPNYSDRISIDPFDLICGRKLHGTWGGQSKPDRDVYRIAKLYLEGKLPLSKLITKCYFLDQINQCLFDIENRLVTRCLIRF